MADNATAIEISGWSKGFDVNMCVRVLHSLGGLSVNEARRVIERVLAGKRERVELKTERDAQLLLSALARLGANAHLAAGAAPQQPT
jgi:hypothetical protein